MFIYYPTHETAFGGKNSEKVNAVFVTNQQIVIAIRVSRGY